MNRFINLMIAITTITSINLTSMISVQAHDLYTKHRHHHHVVRERHNNNDDAIIWGIIGLATGAIIANVTTHNKRTHNKRTHQAPRQRIIYPGVNHYPPRPAKIYDVRTLPKVSHYEPWSQGWYRYCANTYISFNPRKGTYRGYDGRDHFCVVKQ